jgi:CHAT domain-containing protein
VSDGPQSDEHAAHINALVAAHNWAGLIRYWIAHRYEPAFGKAIQILEAHTKGRSDDWKKAAVFLVKFQSNPYDLNQRCEFDVPQSCTALEAATLRLLELYPFAALCEGAAFAPLHLRSQLLHTGFQAAQEALGVSCSIGDGALGAFFLVLMACARAASGESATACDLYQKAQEILWPLSQQQPAIYQLTLARALNGLGMAQTKLNGLKNALTNLNEAAQIVQLLDSQQPGRYAPDLAAIFDNLGAVQYGLNRLGDARTNFTKVAEIRRELTRLNARAYRADFAASLNNLAVVEVGLGEWTAANQDFESALSIRRELASEHPHIYLSAVAETLNNIGNLQRNDGRFEGSRHSLEEALKIRREAARTQPEVFRPQVATTLGNLGNTQHGLNLIEEAVRSYQEAAAIYRELARHQPEVFQPDLAGILGNLGNAELDLALPEAALTHSEQSAEIYGHLAKRQPEAFLQSLAASLNNLGNVRRHFNRLEEAANSYDRALNIYRGLAQKQPAVCRPHFASCLVNLGTVQSDLRLLEPAYASFAEAADLFRQLVMDRLDVFRPSLVTALSNLGNVQRELKRFDAARNSLGEALVVCEGLMRQRPDVHRSDLAGVLNNLGTVHRARESLDEALSCLLKAASLYTQEARVHPFAFLADRLRCWINLGSLYSLDCARLGWPDCRHAGQAFREAVASAELFRSRFIAPQQRQRTQTEVIRVYERLVQCCVEAWERTEDLSALKEAVEVAEAARSRQLLELLQDEVLEPDALPLLVKRYHETRRRLCLLQRLKYGGENFPTSGGSYWSEPKAASLTQSGTDGPSAQSDPPAACRGRGGTSYLGERRRRLGDELSVVAEQHHGLLREIQTRYDPEFDPDQPVPPVKYKTIQALLPRDKPTAIVQYCLGLNRSFAFIIAPSELLVVPLPGFNETEARDAAAVWFRTYYNDTRRRALELYSTALQAGDGGAAATLNEQAASLNEQWTTQWEAALPALLTTISIQAVRPVTDILVRLNVQRLILSLNRSLHLLPLHACQIEENQYLGSKYEIVYSPSLSLLHRCVLRQRQHQDRVLLVTNPSADLPFADVEGEQLRRHYPASVVLDAAVVNKRRFVEETKVCTLLHYSGHCSFDPTDPLGSALVLGSHEDRENWFSLREVFRRLNMPRNRLTVLNGCESGMLIPDLTDDYASLPTGFLYAGATCVLSTLWPVFDLSTALLMDRFHHQLLLGKTPSAALRAAQRWLREDITSGPDLMDRVLPRYLDSLDDARLRNQCLREADRHVQRCIGTPPFQSPAHWAPFSVIGLGYALPPPAEHQPSESPEASTDISGATS